MPTSPYYVNGKRVPGVTTVIGTSLGWNKNQLMYWAFRQGKEGKESLYEKRDEAADAGTLAHLMVEHHIKGEAAPDLAGQSPEVIKQAEQAFASYLEWEKISKVKVISTELSLTSETYGYGGTIDALIEVNGIPTIADWKTSNDVYADHKIQLAAYGHLLQENGFKINGYHLIRFAKDTSEFAHHYYSDMEKAWEAFVLLRRLYDLKKLI